LQDNIPIWFKLLLQKFNCQPTFIPLNGRVQIMMIFIHSKAPTIFWHYLKKS